MRITGLHVDGFGVHHDLDLTLSPHLNVVQGPNEAGKSTLRDFVRAAFFGFPTGKSAVRREPLAGGNHGGRLELTADDGTVLTVSIAPGKKRGGALTVTRADGTEVAEADWAKLLGGISRSYFENVHAFGLRELQELDTLTGREMADYLFGGAVGMDPRRLARARKRLADRLGEVLRPRGRSPLGDRIGELREIRKKIRDVRREAAGVQGLEDDRDRARAEIGAKERRIAELDRDLAAHDRILAVRKDRDAWLAAREALGAHRDVADFPLPAIERHAELTRARDDVTRALADAADELRRARATEQAGRPDPAILANAERIQGLGRLRDTVLRAQGHATATAVAHDAARREHDRRRAARARDEDARAAAQAADRPDRPEDRTGDPSPRHPAAWGMATVCALVVTLGLLAWTFLDPGQRLGAVSTEMAALVAGTITVGLTLFMIRARITARRWARAAHHEDATDIVESSSAAGPDVLIGATGFGAEVVEGGPDPTRGDTDPTPDETDRALDEADQALEEAAAAHERADRALQDAQDALRAALDRLLAALPVAATADLRGLAADEPGEAAARLAERVAAAHQAAAAHGARLDEVDARDRRHRELTARRDELDAACAAVRAEAGSASEETFRDRAARAEHRVALAERVRELEGRIRQALRPVPETLRLLADPGADPETDPDPELHPDPDGDLDAHPNADPNATANPATLDLADLDLDAVAAGRAELVRERRGLRAALDALRESVGAKSNQVETVKGSDRLARLELEASRLEAEIDELAEEWRTLRLSQSLLEDAALAFQRKHQPQVMRTASGFFEAITDGEFRRVMRPLDPEAAPLLCERDGGELLPPEALSRGTREQLFLAIRFAVVRETQSGGAPLPVLMDDVLVNFDPARAARAIRVMAELARTHQVLYFTCHPEVAARFREAEPGVAEYVLAG